MKKCKKCKKCKGKGEIVYNSYGVDCGGPWLETIKEKCIICDGSGKEPEIQGFEITEVYIDEAKEI